MSCSLRGSLRVVIEGGGGCGCGCGGLLEHTGGARLRRSSVRSSIRLSFCLAWDSLTPATCDTTGSRNGWLTGSVFLDNVTLLSTRIPVSVWFYASHHGSRSEMTTTWVLFVVWTAQFRILAI
jgi:hypothetical protein